MDNELHEDRALLQAFREGDPKTLGQLYQRFAPVLGRFIAGGFSTTSDGRAIRIQVDDPNERMEIVQETFARAFTERSRLAYDGYRPYGPYLVRICRNLVIDHVRARRRHARVFVPDEPIGDEPDAPTRIDMASDVSVADHLKTGGAAQVDASRRELARELDAFLKTLGSKEREMLRLYYEDDSSQRDAARAMGLTRNQIRTLVSRVRRSLLEHMVQAGVIHQANPEELLRAVTVMVIMLVGGPL